MNVVMTGDGRLVEVQATAERDPFSREGSTRCSTSPRSGSRRSRRPSARPPMLLAASAPTLSWAEVLLRVGVAGGLAATIGFERESASARPDCARTRSWPSVRRSSRWPAYGFHDFARPFDPTRVAAQVVTGVGFLGAGAIIRQGLSVKGLTTAATLWVAAAIGLAAGAGFYAGAVLTTFGALFILGPLRGVDVRILSRFRPALDRLLVEIPAGGSAVPVIDAIERAGWPRHLSRGGRRRETGARVAVDVELATGSAPYRRRGRRRDRRRARGPVDGVVRAVLCSRNRAQGT